MKYKIKFWTAFKVDELWYVRTGSIKFKNHTVFIEWPKHWNFIARLWLFILLSAIFIALLHIFAWLVILVIIHYFWTSREETQIYKFNIKNIKRNKKIITFTTENKHDGKIKTSLFRASNIEEAKEIEQWLKINSFS